MSFSLCLLKEAGNQLTFFCVRESVWLIISHFHPFMSCLRRCPDLLSRCQLLPRLRISLGHPVLLSQRVVQLISLEPTSFIITTTTICHYYHHNHHHLSLLSSQPPPTVTIIITTTTMDIPGFCAKFSIARMLVWTQSRTTSLPSKLSTRDKSPALQWRRRGWSIRSINWSTKN